MSNREIVANPTRLPVREVRARVHAWVEEVARHWPNFAGAYLWGGITAMGEDASFALWRDVDVVVVMERDAPDEETEELWQGLSIEVIWKNLDEHRDAAAVLANPSAGPNLAATTILADPTGILTRLQRAVMVEFAEQRWIAARCSVEKKDAEESLDKMHSAATPAERLDGIRGLLGALSGLLAVARLDRPTTRRTLALLGELLEAEGHPELQEDALAIMGSAQMTDDAVQTLLDLIVAAYDRSVACYRTSIPYGFALREHLRPYYAEGAQEMMRQGRAREAVYWISCLDTAFLALENDAPEAERAHWNEQFRLFYDTLGLLDDEAWGERVRLAERLKEELFGVADRIMG